jgi:hypothetical protein
MMTLVWRVKIEVQIPIERSSVKLRKRAMTKMMKQWWVGGGISAAKCCW